MKLVKHKTYKEMYYVKWPDGVKSKDFYNITWAGQHIRDLTRYNASPSS